MSRWTYFSDDEGKDIEPELMDMVDVARGKAGIPFIKTCGCRTADHNAAVGGVSDSAHLPDENGLSKAMDIACDNSSDRWKMVFALQAAGLRRIVIEQRHIHTDVDKTKPQDVLALLEKP